MQVFGNPMLQITIFSSLGDVLLNGGRLNLAAAARNENDADLSGENFIS